MNYRMIYSEDDFKQNMEKAPSLTRKHILLGHYMDIIDDLDPNHTYLIGVSCSEGFGQDETVITVLETTTMKIVGYFSSSTITVKETYMLLCVLMNLVFTKSRLAIDETAMGMVLIDLFRRSPEVKIDDTINFSSHENRDRMFTTINFMVKNDIGTLHHKDIVDSIHGLVMNDRGKIKCNIHESRLRSLYLAMTLSQSDYKPFNYYKYGTMPICEK